MVVDAPSLVEQSDVASLAAHADLVILVVREGSADPAEIRRARALLSKFGDGAIGIVINQVSPKRFLCLNARCWEWQVEQAKPRRS